MDDVTEAHGVEFSARVLESTFSNSIDVERSTVQYPTLKFLEQGKTHYRVCVLLAHMFDLPENAKSNDSISSERKFDDSRKNANRGIAERN